MKNDIENSSVELSDEEVAKVTGGVYAELPNYLSFPCPKCCLVTTYEYSEYKQVCSYCNYSAEVTTTDKLLESLTNETQEPQPQLPDGVQFLTIKEL